MCVCYSLSAVRHVLLFVFEDMRVLRWRVLKTDMLAEKRREKLSEISETHMTIIRRDKEVSVAICLPQV